MPSAPARLKDIRLSNITRSQEARLNPGMVLGLLCFEAAATMYGLLGTCW